MKSEKRLKNMERTVTVGSLIILIDSIEFLCVCVMGMVQEHSIAAVI